MSSPWKRRLNAGAVHLAASSCVALSACALIFLVWYPDPYSTLLGVGHLVLILIAVDATIGPLITAVVFSPSKKRSLLKLDIAVIGALQLAALVYGLHSIFLGRPVYLVFNIDRFDVVTAADVDVASQARASIQPGIGGPIVTAARLPRDPEARAKIMFEAVSGGADLPQRPEWFVPYEDESKAAKSKLRPITELRKLNAIDDLDWQKRLLAWGGDSETLGYLPMKSKSRDGSVIISRHTGDIRALTDLQPQW